LDLKAARLMGEKLPGDYFTGIFRSCPNLQDLELQCTYQTNSVLLPPLRSLTLNRVAVEYWDTWIKEYGKLLTKYEKMDAFNRLTLNHCGIRYEKNPESEKRWKEKLPEFNGKLVVI